jgi:hypothetical protein
VTLRLLVQIVSHGGDTRVRELARAGLADLSTLDDIGDDGIVASEERNQLTGRPEWERRGMIGAHRRRQTVWRLFERAARWAAEQTERVVIKTAADVARIVREIALRCKGPSRQQPTGPAFASRCAGARRLRVRRPSRRRPGRAWPALCRGMSSPVRWLLSIRNSAGATRSRAFTGSAAARSSGSSWGRAGRPLGRLSRRGGYRRQACAARFAIEIEGPGR